MLQCNSRLKICIFHSLFWNFFARFIILNFYCSHYNSNFLFSFFGINFVNFYLGSCGYRLKTWFYYIVCGFKFKIHKEFYILILWDCVFEIFFFMIHMLGIGSRKIISPCYDHDAPSWLSYFILVDHWIVQNKFIFLMHVSILMVHECNNCYGIPITVYHYVGASYMCNEGNTIKEKAFPVLTPWDG